MVFAVFFIVQGILWWESESNIYDYIAGKYRKMKISKDVYHYVRKFKVSDYSNFDTASALDKTIVALSDGSSFYGVCVDLLNGREVTRLNQIANVMKYILSRIETSEEYRKVKTKSYNNEYEYEKLIKTLESQINEIIHFAWILETIHKTNINDFYFEDINISQCCREKSEAECIRIIKRIYTQSEPVKGET
jgi:hypothetical protein